MAAGGKGKNLKVMKMFMEAMTKGGGFDHNLSRVELLSGGNGSVSAVMKVEKVDCNGAGTLHGACIALLVDSLSSVALFSHPSPYVGITGLSTQMSITYLSAIRPGGEVLINSTTDRVGRNLAFMTVDISNRETKELIARGSHTKYIGGQDLEKINKDIASKLSKL